MSYGMTKKTETYPSPFGVTKPERESIWIGSNGLTTYAKAVNQLKKACPKALTAFLRSSAFTAYIILISEAP